MPRNELEQFVQAVIAAAPEVGQLSPGSYIAAGVQKLRETDLPHITLRSGNQTHIAVTDIEGTMRLFPLVSSPVYVNTLRGRRDEAAAADKTLYVNEIRFRAYRANVLRKLEACCEQAPGYFKYGRNEIDEWAATVREWPEVFEGHVTAVTQIRSSNQLQLELSRKADSKQWKIIHSVLDVDDCLAILQRPDLTYDFIILPADAIRGNLSDEERDALKHGVKADNSVPIRVATVTPRQLGAVGGAGAFRQTLIDKVVHGCLEFGSTHFIVLWGVPATGKSFVAEAAAKIVATDETRLRIVQFHPSYTYPDLFEGYEPNEEGGFTKRIGVLSELNDLALRDSGNKYVLLIDEFSRADVPSVIGELLTHIEYRSRPFVTPFGKVMTLAPNMVFLGTMNPQDRSALELDDAILRRFRTIKIAPSAEEAVIVLSASLDAAGESPEEVALIEGVKKLFVETEQAHPDEFVEQMPFGPWIFKGVRNWDDVDLLWEQQIEQLIKRPGGTKHPFYDTIVALKPTRVARSLGTGNDTGSGQPIGGNG